MAKSSWVKLYDHLKKVAVLRSLTNIARRTTHPFPVFELSPKEENKSEDRRRRKQL